MIPFFLITGFLGSGKTTLLKQVLHQYAAKRRIAIIQNEFAPSSTDGKELKLSGANFKLVEVNNGSVFCVCMLGNFTHSLEKVIDEYSPELIFLEASGLSDPINILELLQDGRIRHNIQLAHIFTVVDAQNFFRSLRMLNRTRQQVMIADTILLNKSEAVDTDLQALHSMVQEINPFAPVVETSYCTLNLDEYILQDAANHLGATEFGKREGAGRPEVKACVLRTHNRISLDRLEAFARHMMPACPRIKAYVNSVDGKVYMLQSVFNEFAVEIVENYMGPSEIVAFGEGLTPRKLKEQFLSYAE